MKPYIHDISGAGYTATYQVWIGLNKPIHTRIHTYAAYPGRGGGAAGYGARGIHR